MIVRKTWIFASSVVQPIANSVFHTELQHMVRRLPVAVARDGEMHLHAERCGGAGGKGRPVKGVFDGVVGSIMRKTRLHVGWGNGN